MDPTLYSWVSSDTVTTTQITSLTKVHVSLVSCAERRVSFPSYHRPALSEHVHFYSHSQDGAFWADRSEVLQHSMLGRNSSRKGCAPFHSNLSEVQNLLLFLSKHYQVLVHQNAFGLISAPWNFSSLGLIGTLKKLSPAPVQSW